MKVQLVTSPHVRHPAVLQSDFQVDQSVMITFIPIGLLSLISSVRLALGIEPSLYDLNRRIVDGTITLGSKFYANASEALCSQKPDLIGFMTESDSYHHVLQICMRIKEILPSCLVVLGGPHASAVSKQTLQEYRCVDFIVQGEGETAFAELLNTLIKGTREPVAGVAQRDKDGAVTTGGVRPQVAALDSLPFPAYELYQPDPGEEIFLEAGRGCPFRCTFCSTAPFWKRQHRVKSPKRMLAEVKHLASLYGSRRMHFTHDLFTTDRDWVRNVCETLIEAGSPVRWTCSSRTDTIDEELLHVMATAGCDSIYFGLESGSERILREIEKNIPKAHSFRILKACLHAGITPNAGFIGGLPSEDEQSLDETFQAYTQALELGCNPVHVFLFTPYSDSSIFNSLGQTICTGHFLDLPLGHELDIANRELIASNRALFGSYHRPKHNRAREEFFDALEEFPTLVASALLPTLFLARQTGGMFHLFEQWIQWVSSFNAARGAEPYRRFYASAACFCDFLMNLATKFEGVPLHLHSLLHVNRMNHLVAGSTPIPTAMANYRTKMASTDMQVVSLGSKLSIGNVVATLEVEHDVSAALSKAPGTELPAPGPGPLYLVWHRGSTGYIQLLKVDAFTFQTVQILRERPKATAELIVEWLSSPGETRGRGDFSQLLSSLSDAANVGIITQNG